MCTFFLSLTQTAPAVHEHKSNVTSTEKTLTFPINQTTIAADIIPNFKKISTNFTSFIDDLIHGNVIEETSTAAMTTTTTTSTSKPSINDDDFIIKHLKSPTTVKRTQGVTEIHSKHTSPTMNGLLKLAGCNIYGQVKWLIVDYKLWLLISLPLTLSLLPTDVRRWPTYPRTFKRLSRMQMSARHRSRLHTQMLIVFIDFLPMPCFKSLFRSRS